MSSFGSGAVRVGDFMRYFERRYRPVDLGQAARIAGLPERSARRVLRTSRRYLPAPTWQTRRGQSLATDRCFTQLAGRRLKKASIPSVASGLSQASARRVILSLMRRSLTGAKDKASALAALTAPGAAAK